jgi:hypothetical protein
MANTAELYNGNEKIDLTHSHPYIGGLTLKIFNQSGEEVECNFNDVEVILARDTRTIVTLWQKGKFIGFPPINSIESGDRVVIKLKDVTRSATGSKILVSNPVLSYHLKK